MIVAVGQSFPSLMLSDSITASGEARFLYNRIGIRTGPRAVTLRLQPPAGWKCLGSGSWQLPSSADSLIVIPVTLIRQTGAAADFKRVRVTLEWEDDSACSQRLDSFFYVRASALHQFLISTTTPVMDLRGGERSITLPIRIKNTGTTLGEYHLTINSSLLASPLQYDVRLQPGVDSLCYFSVPLPAGGWKGPQKVVVSAADRSGIIYSLPVVLTAVQNSSKAHPTAYLDFPATIEWGLMVADKQLNYVGAAQASWTFSEAKVDLSFRTKVFGFANTLERNVLSIQGDYKRWGLSLGQLSTAQHFFSYGSGVKVRYRLSSATEWGMQMILPTLTGIFTNSTGSLWLQKQTPVMSRTLRIAANFDRQKGLREYLLYHEHSFSYKEKTRVSISLGAGVEHYLRIPVTTNRKPALGGGYRLVHQGKKFEWISSWQHFPSFFPGIDKGVTTHQHQARWLRSHSYFDLFYTYNSIVNTVLTDTIYYADAFRFNFEKMGIRGGFRKDPVDFSFSTGWLRQTDVSQAQLPAYQFGELIFSSSSAAGSRFSVKSLLGYASNRQISRSVFITNTTLTYQRKGSGLRAFFIQQPVLKDSTIKVLLRINQTALISPFLSFRVRKQVGIQIRYSLSKTRFDKKLTSSAALNASWRQPTKGWELSFSGTFPFSRSTAPDVLGISIPFFNLSVKKTLQVPLLTKKRYYQLKVITYEDANSNQRYDSTDRLLPGVKVNVNKESFITGSEGAFTWRHVDTGFYQLSLPVSSAYRGLLPPAASLLSFELQSDKKVMIPFSKSSVIEGVVQFEWDAYSTLQVSAEHLLVKAIDSTGKEYATLTDQKGAYFINLPAGRYTVTLNPEAFKGSLRPVELLYQVDLREQQEATVNFLLREKKRPIRFLKQ